MRDRPRMRRRMVEALGAGGISEPRVLAALGTVPRHWFVPEVLFEKAYRDQALPIGDGQTISQPSTVARMTEALELTGNERVLEVGTGSGYQTAVLSHLARRIYSVERIETLARRAEALLRELGCRNVLVHVTDGTLGWREQSPFDAILVTAGGPQLPAALTAQLADGGRLVAPIGDRERQVLLRVRRRGDEFVTEELGEARFVDLVGEEGWPQR